jgi:hypothetical protein
VNTIACPSCKNFVIAFEVAELRGEVVMFEVDPVLVLVNAGTQVTSGCRPHVCQGMPVSASREKMIPLKECFVNCKYCEERVCVLDAVFNTEMGWKCSLCIKDHAEQEAKKRLK